MSFSNHSFSGDSGAKILENLGGYHIEFESGIHCAGPLWTSTWSLCVFLTFPKNKSLYQKKQTILNNNTPRSDVPTFHFSLEKTDPLKSDGTVQSLQPSWLKISCTTFFNGPFLRSKFRYIQLSLCEIRLQLCISLPKEEHIFLLLLSCKMTYPWGWLRANFCRSKNAPFCIIR